MNLTGRRSFSLHRQLYALIALGFALRLFRLGRQSLWFDEIITVYLAKLPLLDGLDGLLQQGIQLTPFYHWVIKAWLAVGDSEWLVRFPAVCFSLLVIPLMYRLGRVYFGPQAGLLAAALMAVNPFQIWYAQEARLYSALLAAAIGAMLAFARLLQGRGKRSLVALGLFNALGFSAHYFMFLIPTVQFILLLTHFKRYYIHLRGWLAANVLPALILAPWIGYILIRKHIAIGIGWVPRPRLWEPLLTLWNFTLGYQDRPGPVAAIGLAVAAASLIFGVRQAARRGILGQAVLWWFFLPPALVLIFSQGRISFYVDRYLLVIAPALFLLLAAGIAGLPGKSGVRIGAGLVLGLAMLYGTGQVFFDPVHFSKDNWREMAQILRREAQPGDGLVTCTDGYRLALDYYGLNDTLLAETRYFAYPGQLDFNPALAPYRRVWIVASNPRQPQHHLGFSYPRAPNPATLSPATRAWVSEHQAGVLTTAGITAFLYALANPPDLNELVNWVCN